MYMYYSQLRLPVKPALISCDQSLMLDSFQFTIYSHAHQEKIHNWNTHEWGRKFAESVDAERLHPQQARVNLRAAGCTYCLAMKLRWLCKSASNVSRLLSLSATRETILDVSRKCRVQFTFRVCETKQVDISSSWH